MGSADGEQGEEQPVYLALPFLLMTLIPPVGAHLVRTFSPKHHACPVKSAPPVSPRKVLSGNQQFDILPFLC